MNESLSSGSSSQGGFEIDLKAVVIVFTTLQSIVMLLATTGNLIVVIAFLRHMDTKKSTNKFIINLAMADLFTGVDMIYQITAFFVPAIGRNLVTCLLQFQTITVFVLSSQLSIIFCTLDRFVAIIYPFNHITLMSTRNTNIMISVPWLFGLAVGVLPFTGLNNWKEGSPCIYGLVVSQNQLFVAAISTWIQASCCVCMYSSVLKAAWKRRTRVRPGYGNRIRRVDLKSSLTMGIVTVAFTVCWIPFSVTAFIQALRFDPAVAFIGNCLTFVGIAHSIVNPFIYAWQKPEFRRACVLLWKRSSAGERQILQHGVNFISSNIERSRTQ